MHLGVIGGDGRGYVLQDGGLARLGRRNDQAALTLADRRGQVDHAGGDGVLAMLHPQALVGIDGSQVGKADALAQGLGILAVHPLDLVDGGVLFVFTSRTGLAADQVALAQAVATDQVGAHIHVPFAGQVALGAQEAVAVGQNVQHALNIDEAFCLGRCGEDRLHQLGLLQALHVQLKLRGLGPQLGHLQGRGGHRIQPPGGRSEHQRQQDHPAPDPCHRHLGSPFPSCPPMTDRITKEL